MNNILWYKVNLGTFTYPIPNVDFIQAISRTAWRWTVWTTECFNFVSTQSVLKIWYCLKPNSLWTLFCILPINQVLHDKQINVGTVTSLLYVNHDARCSLAIWFGVESELLQVHLRHEQQHKRGPRWQLQHKYCQQACIDNYDIY